MLQASSYVLYSCMIDYLQLRQDPLSIRARVTTVFGVLIKPGRDKPGQFSTVPIQFKPQ